MANDYDGVVTSTFGETSVRATAAGIMVIQDDVGEVDVVLLTYEEAVFVRDQIDAAIQSGIVLRRDQIEALVKETASR